jgi:cytochrome bd-type quinol oxidase subunit 1
MSFYGVIAGVIFTGAGLTLEGISAAITGIRSTQAADSSQRSTLLAAASTVMIGTVLFIVALVLLFINRKKQSKGLKIASIIIMVLAVLLLLTSALISGIYSNQFKESDAVLYGALRTSAILIPIGVLLIVIGYFILNFVIGKRAKAL